MAYRYNKNNNGEVDLIIDGWEKGIATSPFTGIGNIRNLNINYSEGVTYVNYKRKPCTITGGTMHKPKCTCQSPAGIIYIFDSSGQIFKQTAVNGSTFALLTGYTGDTLYPTGLAFWNNYLFVMAGCNIWICGDGTGDAGVNSSTWNTAGGTTGVWPMQGGYYLTTTATVLLGDTSATISSYYDTQGTSRTFWNGPSGSYVCYTGLGSGGQKLLVNLTQGSSAISWTPAASTTFGTNISVYIIDPVSTAISGGGIKTTNSLISKNDGNLYICNGNQIASFGVLPFKTFTKGDMKTFNWNGAALSLPQSESAYYLSEIRNQLLVSTDYNIYPWDRFSPQWQNPIPMQEKIKGTINILNNIYILAGNKGNIYISNGYNAQRFKKLPDYIAGVVDPAWQFGGLMSHRQKLFFNALALNGQTSAPILAGIFSLDLDNGALNMEAQNSFGLASATTTETSFLMDNNSITLNYDNYYSGWSDGASTAGGVDFNDTTLWSSNEPTIETDIIPIGTSIQQKTFTSAEFKLDQPMKSGDSITLYARQSLSDSWTQVGTTTTTVLSDFYPGMTFEKWEWIQFKVTMSCNATATSSSFNRLREIRIR